MHKGRPLAGLFFDILCIRRRHTFEGVSVMRNDQAEEVIRLIRLNEAIEAKRDAEAWQVARGLIQGYLGPDHRVINLLGFHSALAQALRAARMQGQDDGDVLTLR
jgi:hypothetical protein